MRPLDSPSSNPGRWRAVVASFLLSRLAIAILGVVGVATFLDQNTRAMLNPALVWNKWDVLWYQRVAEHGYAYQLNTLQGQATAGFFPLYPLVVRLALHLAPGSSFFWMGTALSNVFSFAALALMASALTKDADESRRMLIIMVTAAGSFYLSIPYTESLFVLLIVLVMVTARARWYVVSAALAGLAAVTRVHGLAAVAIPVVACWLDRRQPSRVRWTRIVAGGVVSAIPFVIYMAHLSAVQGSAAAFVDRQALWNNAFPYPLKAIVGLAQYPTRIPAWIHGAFWALYSWLLIRYRRSIPPGEWIFCLGVLLISTQQETFHGIYRYTLPLVPLVIALARDRSDVRQAVIGINIAVGVLMILAFVALRRLTV